LTPVHRTLWRIGTDTSEYLAEDLAGKGAEKTGGRLVPSVGTPVIYASPTIALAVLETMVHLGGRTPLPLNRYLVKIEVPEGRQACSNFPFNRDRVGRHSRAE